MKKQQKILSVGIFADGENARLSAKQEQDLLSVAKGRGKLEVLKLISHHPPRKTSQFTYVPVKTQGKDSADHLLFRECIEYVTTSSLDIVIIVSGDNGFRFLINALQKLGKTVIVIANEGKMGKQLKKQADEFIYVEELGKMTA